MTNDIGVRKCKPGDTEIVAEYMRQDDIAEVSASSGLSPLEALTLSVKYSTLAWSIHINDEPVGMFGVSATSSLADDGSPWLLGTDRILEIYRPFLKQSRAYVQQMLDRHSFLVNYVDERNLVSVRWLKWCGFKLDDPAPYGVTGAPFHRFELRR
jgi:hypothetical protein